MHYIWQVLHARSFYNYILCIMVSKCATASAVRPCHCSAAAVGLWHHSDTCSCNNFLIGCGFLSVHLPQYTKRSRESGQAFSQMKRRYVYIFPFWLNAVIIVIQNLKGYIMGLKRTKDHADHCIYMYLMMHQALVAQ